MKFYEILQVYIGTQFEEKFHVVHQLTIILSAFASEIPLMASRFFFGAKATDSIVKKPASSSFFTSDALIPCDCKKTRSNSVDLTFTTQNSSAT